MVVTMRHSLWWFNVKRCLCSNSSTTSSDGEETSKRDLKEPPTLPSPDLCCKTGCSNCIFIQYTDELMDYCRSENKDPMEEVKKVTSDPNIRVMIDMLIKEENNKPR